MDLSTSCSLNPVFFWLHFLGIVHLSLSVCMPSPAGVKEEEEKGIYTYLYTCLLAIY
jgi:hypothetical protein